MENDRSDGFDLIWLYWAKKYMNEKIRSKDSISQILIELRKHYSLESVDSRLLLDTKIALIKQQKGGLQWPIYVIDPQRELKSIEQTLIEQDEQFKSELYSYYLNIKNVFIVYCNDWEGSQHLSSRGGSGEDNQHDNISEGNQGYKILNKMLTKIHDNRTEGNKSRPDLYSSSIMNKISHSLQDQSIESRNDSIYETTQHKIDDLQILDKMAEFDGLEIWNCKYKHIPHSYIKIKKQVWKSCFSLPLMHPSQPKFINNLPILPKIEILQPNIDKLLPFVSYLKLLDKYFPGFAPTINSVFQINDLPLVFSREEGSGWNEQSNVSVLCYYIVNGIQQNISINRVQRWGEMNSHTLLGKTIKQMSKRQREKRRLKRDQQSKALVLFDGDQDSHQIW